MFLNARSYRIHYVNVKFMLPFHLHLFRLRILLRPAACTIILILIRPPPPLTLFIMRM